MGQPYIYTMPEGFIEDRSVPIRWKLYALINGFWIAKKPVFASNGFFAEKLNCSERQIQRAIKELEDDGYLQRQGQNQNRHILPATTPDVVAPRRQTAVRHDAGRPHNSDSNSDSITSALEYETRGERVRFKEDEDEKPARKSSAKYPHSKEVFELWGKYPRSWESMKNVKERDAAENLYHDLGLEEIKACIEFLEKHGSEKFCPQIFSPYDLQEKYKKLEAYSHKHD